MIAPAQVVNGVDENLDVRGIGELRDTVAEVEDMARSFTEGREHLGHFRPDSVGRSEQHRGIQISLQGSVRADASPRFPNVHGPVESYSISARRGNVFEPVTAAFREDNARHDIAGSRAMEMAHNALHIRE